MKRFLLIFIFTLFVFRPALADNLISSDSEFEKTKTEFEEMSSTSSNNVKVLSFDLKNANPEQVFNWVNALKSEYGRVWVEQASGKVLLLDKEENLEKMRDILETLENSKSAGYFKQLYDRQFSDGIIKIFQLEQADPDFAWASLTPLKNEFNGRVLIDRQSRQVLLVDNKENMKRMQNVIETLENGIAA